MRRFDPGSSGMTLPELLVAVVVLGLMAAVGIGGVGRSLARTRVEAAARQLAVDLEQARSSAEAAGTACALELTPQGWSQDPASDLPPCRVATPSTLQQVQLRHNLPTALRIASNGLVLDGGTVVVAAAGSDLQRCLVVSLPLGVVRTGQSKAAAGATPRSSDCVVDPSL